MKIMDCPIISCQFHNKPRVCERKDMINHLHRHLTRDLFDTAEKLDISTKGENRHLIIEKLANHSIVSEGLV